MYLTIHYSYICLQYHVGQTLNFCIGGMYLTIHNFSKSIRMHSFGTVKFIETCTFPPLQSKPWDYILGDNILGDNILGYSFLSWFRHKLWIDSVLYLCLSGWNYVAHPPCQVARTLVLWFEDWLILLHVGLLLPGLGSTLRCLIRTLLAYTKWHDMIY